MPIEPIMPIMPIVPNMPIMPIMPIEPIIPSCPFHFSPFTAVLPLPIRSYFQLCAHTEFRKKM